MKIIIVETATYEIDVPRLTVPQLKKAGKLFGAKPLDYLVCVEDRQLYNPDAPDGENAVTPKLDAAFEEGMAERQHQHGSVHNRTVVGHHHRLGGPMKLRSTFRGIDTIVTVERVSDDVAVLVRPDATAETFEYQVADFWLDENGNDWVEIN